MVVALRRDRADLGPARSPGDRAHVFGSGHTLPQRCELDLPQAHRGGTGGRDRERGVDRAVEVKCRAAGFKQFCDWLDKHDVLIAKSDRLEPLVAVRLSLAEVQGHMA